MGAGGRVHPHAHPGRSNDAQALDDDIATGTASHDAGCSLGRCDDDEVRAAADKGYSAG